MANRPTLGLPTGESETSLNLNKRNRVPIGGNRDILTVQGKDPNFVYRWVLEDPQRIIKFEDAGYSVVTKEELEIGQTRIDTPGKAKDGSLYRKNAGRNAHLILMKIRKEWYDEDQKEKQQQVDAAEAAMRQNTLSEFGTSFANTLDIGRK